VDARDRIDRRGFGALVLAALAGCAPLGTDAARSSPSTSAPPRASGSPEAVGATASSAPAVEPPPPSVERPLLRRHPALRERLGHIRLGDLPTPVEPLEALGAHLGAGVLWVKRDDRSGRVYGGGKTRKLEWLLGAAAAAGARTVVTSGGAGSNHVVATALHAGEHGMRSVLLLLPQPTSAEVRHNLLLARRFGGELRSMPGRDAIARAERELSAGGAYVIPVGGSSPVGNIGYVDAALELEQQVAAGSMPEPDVLYIALGTMGAAAGLAVGLGATRLRTRVVAVRASSPETSSERRLRSMMDATLAHLRDLDRTFDAPGYDPARVTIAGGQLGRGYALPTAAGRAAMHAAHAHAGLQLELTYTAKTVAEIAARAPRHQREVLLFWHTHNSREVDLGAIDRTDLPAELQGYFAGT
jgi:D-cysteine desulfhydrase